MQPSVAGAGSELLAGALLACEADRLSGVLRVTGEPGGLLHLSDGNVTSIETAGAPGPDLILVRSGRIPEASWAAAFTAAAAGGRMGLELVRRGLIGAGELEAVLRVALADAMFAVAGGRVDECAVEQARPSHLLPLDPPAAPGWLLQETSRRLRVLASTAGLVRHDQDRVTADPDAPSARAGALPKGRDEIIALANGRRTARDMAFILGRGVYALSLELSRMHESGLITVTSRRNLRPPRQAPQESPRPGSEAVGADVPAHRPAPASDLPRRHQPGRQPRQAPADIMPPSSSTLLRLLRLLPAGDREPSGPADQGAET